MPVSSLQGSSRCCSARPVSSSESGSFLLPDSIRREHETLGIAGRHYSRFGDALVPVIRDVIGRGTPREVSSAWVDGFWAMIRAVQADPAKAAA